MPIIAIPFGVMIVAAVLLALLAFYFVIVRPWLLEASNLALIGGTIRRAVNAMEDSVISVWESYVEAPAKALASFFQGIGEVIRDLPEQVSALAADTADAVGWITGTGIPRAVASVKAAGASAVAAVDARVDGAISAVTRLRNAVDGRLDDLETYIASKVPAPVASLADELRRYARGIDRRVDQLADDLVDDAVKPLTALRDVTVPRLGTRVKGLEDDLAAVAPYVVGLAGAVTLSQAIEGIRAASRAKPKLDRLCTLDLDEVEDMLGFGFAALALTELVDLVREGATIAAEAADEIRTIIKAVD